MEQNPWEANSPSCGQAVLPFYRTQMFTNTDPHAKPKSEAPVQHFETH
jgi:hypothetical protein